MLGEAKSLQKMYEGEIDSRGNPLGLGIRINECNDSIIIVEGMHMAERIAGIGRILVYYKDTQEILMMTGET
jgi:hypothetical protein